jgi:hypothetical protein
MDRVWVKTSGFQGVIDQRLQPVIAFDHHNLKQTFFGAAAQSTGGFKLFSTSGKQIGAYKNVMIHEPWLVVQQDSTWRLFSLDIEIPFGNAYDSMKFAGPFAIGFNSDSVFVHFSSTLALHFPRSVVPSFIPGKDSTAFLIVLQDRKKTLYNQRAERKFQFDYENIEYAGEGLFIVSKKEKKGLINNEGKLLLPVEFDAIGSVANHVVSLLKNMKFGAYHGGLKKLIKPQYDKNLSSYNRSSVSAFQKDFYGFVDWDNKPLSKFEFDEVKYWNDSTALVKKNFNWQLYDIVLKKAVEENIKSIDYIVDSEEEKLGIIKQENNFGVVSNRKGFTIPATFSNVVNVGSAEEPLYFTEKHVEEASIFVVIYYDRKGKMLYRQVYEEHDYEKILCSDN